MAGSAGATASFVGRGAGAINIKKRPHRKGAAARVYFKSSFTISSITAIICPRLSRSSAARPGAISWTGVSSMPPVCAVFVDKLLQRDR